MCRCRSGCSGSCWPRTWCFRGVWFTGRKHVASGFGMQQCGTERLVFAAATIHWDAKPMAWRYRSGALGGIGGTLQRTHHDASSQCWRTLFTFLGWSWWSWSMALQTLLHLRACDSFLPSGLGGKQSRRCSSSGILPYERHFNVEDGWPWPLWAYLLAIYVFWHPFQPLFPSPWLAVSRDAPETRRWHRSHHSTTPTIDVATLRSSLLALSWNAKRTAEGPEGVFQAAAEGLVDFQKSWTF